MTIYEKIVHAATVALEEMITDGKTTIKANELFSWIQANQQKFTFDVDELRGSWGPYLTRAMNDPKTMIARQPGKYSLILKDKQTEFVQESVTEESPSEADLLAPAEQLASERQKREEVLYELLADWLISKGYSSDVTANTRKGEKWGNPDVVGISLVDDPLGRQQIEIGTIEAKISLAGWRKELFEAVSHKRFANRAYFAFAVGANDPAVENIQQYSELRKYGERYRVGVLAVFLDEDDYQQLVNSDVSSLKLSLEEVVVSEIWPAMYDLVETAEMYNFVKNVLSLDSPTKVNSFGRR